MHKSELPSYRQLAYSVTGGGFPGYITMTLSENISVVGLSFRILFAVTEIFLCIP